MPHELRGLRSHAKQADSGKSENVSEQEITIYVGLFACSADEPDAVCCFRTDQSVAFSPTDFQFLSADSMCGAALRDF